MACTKGAFDFQQGLTRVGFSSFRKNSIEIISGGRVMLNCKNVVLLFFLAASITEGSKEKWRVTPAWCEYRNLKQDVGGKNCVRPER